MGPFLHSTFRPRLDPITLSASKASTSKLSGCPPVGMRTKTSFPARQALMASRCCGRKPGTPKRCRAAATGPSHSKPCAQLLLGARCSGATGGGACHAPGPTSEFCKGIGIGGSVCGPIGGICCPCGSCCPCCICCPCGICCPCAICCAGICCCAGGICRCICLGAPSAPHTAPEKAPSALGRCRSRSRAARAGTSTSPPCRRPSAARRQSGTQSFSMPQCQLAVLAEAAKNFKKRP